MRSSSAAGSGTTDAGQTIVVTDGHYGHGFFFFPFGLLFFALFLFLVFSLFRRGRRGGPVERDRAADRNGSRTGTGGRTRAAPSRRAPSLPEPEPCRSVARLELLTSTDGDDPRRGGRAGHRSARPRLPRARGVRRRAGVERGRGARRRTRERAGSRRPRPRAAGSRRARRPPRTARLGRRARS